MLILTAAAAGELAHSWRWLISDYSLDTDTRVSHNSGIYIGTGSEVAEAAEAVRLFAYENGAPCVNTAIFHDFLEDGISVEPYMIYIIQAYRMLGDYTLCDSAYRHGIPLGALYAGMDFDLALSMVNS